MNSKFYGLISLFFRYFNVFGLRQNINSEHSGVISKLIKAISENKSPEIYEDGAKIKYFTYLMHIVNANIAAANKKTKPGTILNAATSKQTDLDKMLKQLNKIFE